MLSLIAYLRSTQKPTIIRSISHEIKERKTPVTTVLTTNIHATFTTNSSSDFYYNRFDTVGFCPLERASGL